MRLRKNLQVVHIRRFIQKTKRTDILDTRTFDVFGSGHLKTQDSEAALVSQKTKDRVGVRLSIRPDHRQVLIYML